MPVIKTHTVTCFSSQAAAWKHNSGAGEGTSIQSTYKKLTTIAASRCLVLAAAKCQNLTNFGSAWIFKKSMTIFVSTKSLCSHG
jgi:hypothetical protein